MPQLPLFDSEPISARLETFIERRGDRLDIPESIQTIPCTHGMHRFPGKFIPNIPRYIIRSILGERTGSIIFDPFCGSGTTLVEAALEGRPFLGMDIDPLAVAMARAKTTAIAQKDLTLIVRYWRNYDYDRPSTDLVPQVPNLSHWFTSEAVAELSAIKAGCLALPARLRLFCLVVFSSIIRRVSNADDQSQKTYVSHTLRKAPPLPSKLFPVFLKRAVNGMREYVTFLPRSVVGKVVQGDARIPPKDHFDDVITSPPYIDSIDYRYNQMLEYFWLLPEMGLNDYDGYRSLRKTAMGFSGAVSSEPHRFENRLGPKMRREFKSIRRHIEDRSPKEAGVLSAFFDELLEHCDATYSRQEPGAYYICIIGNSLIRRVTVPTSELLVELFRSTGYRFEDRVVYQIRRHYMKFPRRNNSGKIKQDHILFFRR